MNPEISVIMSVYNGSVFLQDAINSILQQTFQNFEFIIIDDGSTDRTWNTLKQCNDDRVITFKNNENIGLTKSLNFGILKAKGNYIARMDADDISCPDRFLKQITFLKKNNYSLSGSWVKVIDDKNIEQETIKYQTNNNLIKWKLLFHNQFAHSSTMFKKDIISDVGTYNNSILYSQDYDFFSRISDKYDVSNFPEILHFLRIWKNSISHQRQAQQLGSGDIISKRNIENLLGQKIGMESIRLIRLFYQKQCDLNYQKLTNLAFLIKKIFNNFSATYTSIGNRAILKYSILKRFVYLIKNSSRLSSLEKLLLYIKILLLFHSLSKFKLQ